MKHRIELVDALRGFAVLAILLLHNLEHFIFPVYPTDSPEWLSVMDSFCSSAIFAIFAGKAYAIFSLLFGFSFHIQFENQRSKGKDFGYRYLWRLVGCTHTSKAPLKLSGTAGLGSSKMKNGKVKTENLEQEACLP